MPKLTCRPTHLIFKRLILVAWATFCGNTLAGDEPSGQTKQTFAFRAAGPVPDDFLKTFMTLVDTKTLSKSNYPDLNQLTATQIISVLCGSFRSAYWDQLREINSSIKLPHAPDMVIGEAAYQVKWPACVFVNTKPTFKYVVKQGDTASGVYEFLTGTPGESHTIEQYFKTSGIPNLDKIKPGQKLIPNHITATTIVKASFSPDEFRSTLRSSATTRPALSTVKFSVSPAQPTTPSAENRQLQPRFEIAAGRIESAVSETYENPPECTAPSAPNQPFNTLWLFNAYKDSMEAVKLLNLDQVPTKVTIADNGFFGANVISGNIIFGSHFPARFFTTSQVAGAGIIGPMTTTTDGKIHPINYLNGRHAATIVSGHGTHIAGLVLGGADFQPYLSIFDRSEGVSWLRLWIVNIGDGGETLIPNSTSELNQQINLLKDNIVNLSIEYEEPTGVGLNAVFVRLTDSSTNNLFVVSAGNDGNPDLSDVPYYPASLGGTSQRNVITVAAHRPNGELATFSNRGASSVDLAAPGCDLSSWLDDSGKVSKVSGTSQAAALVTFAATLLRSLGDLLPVEIKNRLMISGDLLKKVSPSNSKPKSVASVPDPSEILSRSKLNIVRALYIFDDYLKYTSLEDGTVHEVLGIFQGMAGISCSKPFDRDNLWAIKASEEGLWLYKGKKSPLQVVQAPCLASASSDALIEIKIRAELNSKGVPIPVSGGPIRTVRISELNQLVTASRPYRHSL
ncbi:S8 family serine peptidase [Pseudomonas sp. UMAB-40]|uniref:S8 family serine peptidase n=1 Tax=Pseudomonas sp. UMAB-40 TaxID=1365407 RepID=UPI001C55B9E8|nr:S8 family serine peptidase [Pseudomonas sp. UMAB-40]